MTALHSIFIALNYVFLFGPLAPLTFLYAIGEWSQGRGKDVWWYQYSIGAGERYPTFRFRILGCSAIVFTALYSLAIRDLLR